jgi:Galactose oxidase, central domain
MDSQWYACSPCQICNEESTRICYCSKVYLCEYCLPKHLMLEVSNKHRTELIENYSVHEDQTELKRKDVVNSIKSKLQNEALKIEEFKRISLQTIEDYIQSLEKEITQASQRLMTNVEEMCAKAEQDLRDALSLSKLSLNVNHPILDMFKACKSVEDVKNVQIVHKFIKCDKFNFGEIIKKYTCFEIEINKDFKSRNWPLKSPAELVKQDLVKRSSTSNEDKLLFSQNDLAKSLNKSYVFSNYEPIFEEKSYSKIWTTSETYSSNNKIYMEMELQERNKTDSREIKEPIKPFEYNPVVPCIYKFQPNTQIIQSMALYSQVFNEIAVPNVKFSPKASWSITEDEKIVYSGGFDGSPKNFTLLFNLRTNKAEKAGNMAYARYNHSLISCGKYIFAIGGINSKLVKECEKFSLERKEWSKAGNLMVGRECPGTCYHSNRIFICGGNSVESFEIFNLSNNKFSFITLRLLNPGKCCLFPYDNSIYILQQDKLYKYETNKVDFSLVNTVENKEWWSPCEAQVTTSEIFFCTGEDFYSLNLNTNSISLIHFITK